MCVSVCLSVCGVCLSVCLSVCLCVFECVYVWRGARGREQTGVCLCVCVCVGWSVIPPGIETMVVYVCVAGMVVLQRSV